MKKEQILNAWKNPDYRRSLSQEELAKLPEHPSAPMQSIDDEALQSIAGGCCEPGPPSFCTQNCTGGTTCVW